MGATKRIGSDVWIFGKIFKGPNAHRLICHDCEGFEIYLEWHSGSASNWDPGVPSSIPIAAISNEWHGPFIKYVE